MNVLYIVRYPLDDTFSIKQKIDGQILAMKNLGLNVFYLAYDREYFYLINENDKITIGKVHHYKSKLFYHFWVYRDLFKYSLAASERMPFDIVYIRSSPLNSFAPHMFKKLSAKSKVVVEIPSYSKTKKKERMSIFRKIYLVHSHSLWKKCAKYTDLFTIIGDIESVFLGRPAININNAVSFNGIEIKQNCQPKDGKIHMLALASMSEWHGYDRIIKGISCLDNETKSRYILDMVGDEGDGSLKKWKELAHGLDLDDIVKFHGKKTGKDLSDIFDCSTIGISSLGFYRIGFMNGSVLKLREYMARGLPFVYAHDDPDIKDWMEWCIKMPNNEEPIDMNAVCDFIDKISSHKNISIEMRKYAEQNMTWESQFTKILNYINNNISK